MGFDNIQPAHYIIAVMKIFGLWHHKAMKWSRLYRLYALLLHTNTVIFIMGTYVNVVVNLHDINQLSGALYMSLADTAFLVKMVMFLNNRETVVKLFETFENAYDGLPHTLIELAVLQSEHKGFSRLRNSYGTGILITMVVAFASAFVTWNIPFPYWIPFEYHSLPNFYYAYIFVTLGIIVTASSNGALDLCQAYLLFQIANYYKLLGKRLELLGKVRHTNDMHLLELMNFNSFIVDITGKCENLISIPVMVQIFMSAFVICFTAFRLNSMHFLDDPSNFVVLLVFGMVMALQIYLPCSYGNELTLSAYNLTNAIYSSNWFDLPVRMQKDINIYMEYLKRPVAVRAGNFFEIGLHIFTQTMNNAYRLYAVLVNIGQ